MITELYINSVKPFAQYDGKIYSYQLKCTLKNGKQIVIIDEIPINFNDKINQKVKVILGSCFFSENTTDCENIFLGVIEFNSAVNQYFFLNDELSIILDRDVIVQNDIKQNKQNYYCFEEIVLKEYSQP